MRLQFSNGPVALFGDALYGDAGRTKMTDLMAFDVKITRQCANSEYSCSQRLGPARRSFMHPSLTGEMTRYLGMRSLR